MTHAEATYRGTAAITSALESLLVSQPRIAAAEAWGEFGNPEEGKSPPLETVAGGSVKILA
jgi:hypothetical protein